MTNNLTFDELISSDDVAPEIIILPSGHDSVEHGQPVIAGVQFSNGVSGFLLMGKSGWGKSVTISWHSDQEAPEEIYKANIQNAQRIFYGYCSLIQQKHKAFNKDKPKREARSIAGEAKHDPEVASLPTDTQPVSKVTSRIPTPAPSASRFSLKKAALFTLPALITAGVMYFFLGMEKSEPQFEPGLPEKPGLTLFKPEKSEPIFVPNPETIVEGQEDMEDSPVEPEVEEDEASLELLEIFKAQQESEDGTPSRAVQIGRINEMREDAVNHHGISDLPDPSSWFGTAPVLTLEAPGGANYKDLNTIQEFGLEP